MPRPTRPFFVLFFFLASSFVALRSARAQDNTQPPAPTTTATAPPPTTAAPPPPPPARRQDLMAPGAADTSAAGPSAPAPRGPSVPTIDTSKDAQQLSDQGTIRPPTSDGSIPANPAQVYAEDWWGKARPVFEIHGYFRVRSELFHDFSLGRHNAPGEPGLFSSQNLWPQPLDNSYTDSAGNPHNIALCGGNNALCYDKTESGANMRFRVNPELHISDNLRILSQVDMLDNVVLGSNPDAYAMKPSGASTNGSGYVPAGPYNGYAPVGVFSTTQGSPTSGVNGYANSINVTRVWGEYQSPIGQVRFGRMPDQWGLGMVANAGDGLDSDYQSNVDRIMFITGVKSIDFYFGGAWDFPNSGPTNASPYDVYGGQPYNTCNLCNVNEWVLFFVHKTNPELQKLQLARGDFVLNGGIYTLYRSQYLDVTPPDTPYTAPLGNTTQGLNSPNGGLLYRDARAIIPDLWVQALWKKLRFEAEFATIQGYTQGYPLPSAQQTNVSMYGLATQTEYRAVEDKLRLQFGFGWASGDPWNYALNPGPTGLQPELNGTGPISTFRFHPDYRVDLIFFRHILSRVEGAYYFRPSVDYDFARNPNGQKFGGGAAIIWSRASEFEQTPGHHRDLGVELDLQLYYQSKDGSLNDNPDKLGGFYSALQYGVFFPLAGLNYLPGQQNPNFNSNWDTSSAQTVRLILGVAY